METIGERRKREIGREGGRDGRERERDGRERWERWEIQLSVLLLSRYSIAQTLIGFTKYEDKNMRPLLEEFLVKELSPHSFTQLYISLITVQTTCNRTVALPTASLSLKECWTTDFASQDLHSVSRLAMAATGRNRRLTIFFVILGQHLLL